MRPKNFGDLGRRLGRSLNKPNGHRTDAKDGQQVNRQQAVNHLGRGIHQQAYQGQYPDSGGQSVLVDSALGLHTSDAAVGICIGEVSRFIRTTNAMRGKTTLKAWLITGHNQAGLESGQGSHPRLPRL